MVTRLSSPPEPVLIAAPADDLCLAFADTRMWRGLAAPEETLHAAGDLLDWCARSGALPPAAVERLSAEWQSEPEAAARLFADALVVRETIYRAFGAIASARPPAAADLAALNRLLAEVPARHTVEPQEGGFGWRVETLPGGVAGILAAVLWSAGDLLVGRRRGRIRQCANSQCLWLFVDDSKSGTRRWCSMSSCGNRAKAHRHYVRRKRTGAGERA